MLQVKFGRKDEPATSFQKSDDLIAVRTRSTRSLLAGPVLSPAAAAIEDSHMIMAFPEAGVEVFRVPVSGPAARSLAERKASLVSQPDVRFAGGVLVEEGSEEPVVYTENLFIKFIDEADLELCRTVIREAGLAIKQEVDYATNAFFVAAPEGSGTQVFDLALALLDREDVEYCHPEILRQRSFRGIFAPQWHLKSTTINNVLINASANVEPAHQITTGEGITIAVIDDGIDIAHPEFGSPGKLVAPRDATLGTNDPRPKDSHPRYPDNHGTACAGVACAAGLEGASGVAPGARLMPIRLVSGLGSQQEASAFRWAADHGADVISCSWGPPDGVWYNPNDPRHNHVFPMPASTRLAIDYATTQGRDGKGCLILFAAGNGNESVDNDGYASYEGVIAVAACNDRGKRCVYSDFGKAVWCSFPSRDFGHQPFNHPDALTTGIWTTDRSGIPGYNNGSLQLGDVKGDYTNSFGGTSSSCPGAAGVAALVLSVNPELRWQEVREILAHSCDKIDTQGGQYDASSGRSSLYGHGRLNAERAVQLAQPAPVNRISIIRTFNRTLRDLHTVRVAVEVNEAEPVEDLSVQVEIQHTYIGDLVVTLVPPSGSSVVLHNRQGGATRNLKRAYDAHSTPAMSRFKGKSAKGKWTLKVEDRATRDVGKLLRYGLELTLAPPPREVDAASANNTSSEDGIKVLKPATFKKVKK